MAPRPLPPIGEMSPVSSKTQHMTLEDFVSSKLEECVQAMNGSSSQSLYLTLMRAVERPLIELALKETNGNQSQASQLLGMNRNTLRKKIEAFNISVKRKKNDQSKEKREVRGMTSLFPP